MIPLVSLSGVMGVSESGSGWEWDPTILDRTGDEYDREAERELRHRKPHTDPEVLRDHAKRMSVREMSREFEVGITSIQRQLRRHDISPSVTTSTYREPRGDDARVVTPPGESEQDRNEFPCPVCERVYESREEESACIRSHSREVAESTPDDVWG